MKKAASDGFRRVLCTFIKRLIKLMLLVTIFQKIEDGEDEKEKMKNNMLCGIENETKHIHNNAKKNNAFEIHINNRGGLK